MSYTPNKLTGRAAVVAALSLVSTQLLACPDGVVTCSGGSTNTNSNVNTGSGNEISNNYTNPTATSDATNTNRINVNPNATSGSSATNGSVTGTNALNSDTTNNNNNAQHLNTTSGAAATGGNQALHNTNTAAGGTATGGTATGGNQSQAATATSAGSSGNNTDVSTTNTTNVRQAANAIGMPTMVAPQLPATFNTNLCTKSHAETGVQVFLGGSTTQGSAGLGFTTPSESNSEPDMNCVSAVSATQVAINAGHDDAGKYIANQATKSNVYVQVVAKPTTSCEQQNAVLASTDPSTLDFYGSESEPKATKLARMNASLCKPQAYLAPQQPRVASITVRHMHHVSKRPAAPKAKINCDKLCHSK